MPYINKTKSSQAKPGTKGGNPVPGVQAFRYFHITDKPGFDGIMHSGQIRASENGKVYLLRFDSKTPDRTIREICVHVAWSQMFIIEHCYILEIDPMGLHVPVHDDWCAEITWEYMAWVEQPAFSRFKPFSQALPFSVHDIRRIYRRMANKVIAENPDLDLLLDVERGYLLSRDNRSPFPEFHKDFDLTPTIMARRPAWVKWSGALAAPPKRVVRQVSRDGGTTA